jgi:phage-related protein
LTCQQWPSLVLSQSEAALLIRRASPFRPRSGFFFLHLAKNTNLYIIHAMKDLRFLGNSLDDLRKFPALAMREAGYQMDRVQNGKDPADWKPIEVVGARVKEIRIWDEAGTFRVIYLAKLTDAVYVLHCFQKKTQETSKKDINLARKLYRELMRIQP